MNDESGRTKGTLTITGDLEVVGDLFDLLNNDREFLTERLVGNNGVEYDRAVEMAEGIEFSFTGWQQDPPTLWQDTPLSESIAPQPDIER